MTGAAGSPGSPGAAGPIGIGTPGNDGDDGYDGWAIIGPQGPPGVGGSASFTDFTKDLGVSNSAGNFTITGLSGLTAEKRVMVMQTPAQIASKGNARDEVEMDQIQVTGYVVNATTIQCYWRAPNVVVGTYAFAYLVGA